MDAQNRGQADDIDPADQWVLNPQTGNYELRLDHSAGQSSPPAQQRGAAPGRGASPSDTPRADTPRDDAARGGSARTRTSTGDAEDAPPRADVPGPRSRRAGKGAADTAPASAGRRKRKAKKSGKRKWLLWTGGVLAFVLVGGSATAYYAYQHFNGNIATIDVQGGSSEGFQKDQPINILLIGTDKRTGAGNEGYGDKGSVGHADTNLLFHVSKDRTNATVLSIPRDLITDIPECTTKKADGSTKTIPGTPGQRFNTSLGQDDRDPGCTMLTVAELTGLKIDHFMMADFNAVKTMSTAVGGVKICLAKDINDRDSHLRLTKGEHVVQGEEALAFVRTRHSVGLGGDLSRIELQQQFLSSLIRQMKSSDTLTSPTKLWSLAEAATKALTVDTGIGNIEKLSGLAKELAKVDPKNVTFATLPVIDNPDEPTPVTVVVNETPAKQLFAMMQNDTSLTEVAQQKEEAKTEQAKLLAGPKAAAADVRVDVYNGGGPPGSAQETLAWLQNTEGVPKSTNKGNAPANVAKTTLEYAPNQADQARALAAMMGLPASAMQQGTVDAEGLEAMTLTLGPDFKGAGVPVTGPAKAPENMQKVEGDKQVCAK